MYKARGGEFKKASMDFISKQSRVEPNMTAEDKNPRGGLSAKGRAKLRRAGFNVRPGVKGKVDTPEKARRKGSFLRRHYGRANPHPLKDNKGRPTRYALQARAWGEPVPQNNDDVRRLAAKGSALLGRENKEKTAEIQHILAVQESGVKLSSLLFQSMVDEYAYIKQSSMSPLASMEGKPTTIHLDLRAPNDSLDRRTIRKHRMPNPKMQQPSLPSGKIMR